jgi:uncharacterized protein (DUF4415 family)
MTGKEKKFVPGRGYTKQDWDAVDSPPATDEQLAQARPFREAFPELAAKMERKLAGRPKFDRPKKAISIRLDQDVIDKFKATGPGWQSRINDVLKAAKP